MHFSSVSLFSLLSLSSFAMGIQTIYLGYVENSAQNAYIAWFSDSPDVCTEGTVFGEHQFGSPFTYCDDDITILSHTNITFTGCNPHNTTSLPTGVSDLGAPALTCNAASTPPGGFPCAANGGAGVIEVLEYCT
ncbi:hypothetical protein BDR22DRAFT_827111 [Usnea florida]